MQAVFYGKVEAAMVSHSLNRVFWHVLSDRHAGARPCALSWRHCQAIIAAILELSLYQTGIRVKNHN